MDEKEQREILSVKDLKVQYVTRDEVVNAVNGVSFTLNYGETLGLVGETGAGKTTIAKAIMGILPQPQGVVQPDSSIKVDGKETLTLENKEMRMLRGGKISMIFQDPMTALNPCMRVGTQIADAVRCHTKCKKKEALEEAQKLLEMVGIPGERYREYPHQFSGGMKQRVVIAMALACNPDLIIADEPTSALDVTIQDEILEMIKKLQLEKNAAMIMITHDLGIVSETCDKVAIIYAGQIVEYGTRDQIFHNMLHPYSEGLFAAIPTLETKVDRLQPINGSPADPTNLPKGCYFSPRCPYATEQCREKEVGMYTMEDGHMCRCLKYAGE